MRYTMVNKSFVDFQRAAVRWFCTGRIIHLPTECSYNYHRNPQFSTCPPTKRMSLLSMSISPRFDFDTATKKVGKCIGEEYQPRSEVCCQAVVLFLITNISLVKKPLADWNRLEGERPIITPIFSCTPPISFKLEIYTPLSIANNALKS
mmetsp:Transcript_51820/g.155512  ORF Transcript_51820/g.155512 Transcript_51820/m.155512 type:complete len:149 (-) Transcript_51820:6-452(-)